MKLEMTFLKSKVARRIFFLFIGCALLPILALTAVSFHEVSTQLRNESRKQLAQASKAQGMAIYYRLETLQTELKIDALQIDSLQSALSEVGPERHFQTMTRFGSRGQPTSVMGEASSLPSLTTEERQHLVSGNSLLKVRPCFQRAGVCIEMVRLINFHRPEAGTLVAELNPDYLWGSDTVPGALELCIFDSSKVVLSCSGGNASSGVLSRSAWQASALSGLFQWNRGGTLYDAAYWSLFLKPRFLANSWTVVLSQRHEDVLASMNHFRNTFPFVILLAVWIVMLFSVIQIRRTLNPLEKLQEGTRQIGARRFDSRVDVRSGDEFQDLATSFNSMATRLGTQFHALGTINDIHRAILASLSREGIVDAALDHMPDLFPSDCVGVALIVGGYAWMRFRMTTSGGAPRTRAVETPVTGTDLRRMQENPEMLVVSEGQAVPNFILPLTDVGLSSFLLLPILVSTQIFAVLICANRNAPLVGPDDMRQVRQIADQLAVAFSNVKLIEALEELHWGSLTALARAIDAKSAWTAGHSERVTNVALQIGRAMALSPKELQIMHRGGLLHDIGKIGTPPAILDKPGKLDPEEMRIMQDHVRVGLRILEPIPGFSEALPIVAQHHESFDGSGYPLGLAGENISLYARIFSVADCYDAMISDRPYRKGLPKEQALEIMRRNSGTQFDPKVIETFVGICAADQSFIPAFSPKKDLAGSVAAKIEIKSCS